MTNAAATSTFTSVYAADWELFGAMAALDAYTYSHPDETLEEYAMFAIATYALMHCGVVDPGPAAHSRFRRAYMAGIRAHVR
jgi:hypothetical protein